MCDIIHLPCALHEHVRRATYEIKLASAAIDEPAAGIEGVGRYVHGEQRLRILILEWLELCRPSTSTRYCFSKRCTSMLTSRHLSTLGSTLSCMAVVAPNPLQGQQSLSLCLPLAAFRSTPKIRCQQKGMRNCSQCTRRSRRGSPSRWTTGLRQPGKRGAGRGSVARSPLPRAHGCHLRRSRAAPRELWTGGRNRARVIVSLFAPSFSLILSLSETRVRDRKKAL